MSKSLSFIDLEVGLSDRKIHDIGAVSHDGRFFHSANKDAFYKFIAGSDFLCGHNIVHHDLDFLTNGAVPMSHYGLIDTLFLSPLLFPKKPYHALLKDDKLQVDECNNPVNDCIKARELFRDEINAFEKLPEKVKGVYFALLYSQKEFKGFFDYMDFLSKPDDLIGEIRVVYKGLFCENADLEMLVRNYPVELAYSLALVSSDDYHSVTPHWLLRNFPKIENVVKYLRNRPCSAGCDYCKRHFDIHVGLKRFFGYDQFRTFDGEPLQELAVQKAVEGKSLLAIFPTGGGKSLTFQLPALMAGENVHGLTVVISPLQSLMKDQVDNLYNKGITDAVTINGLLDPVTRADACERVLNGSATMLYISPEMLRSRTIEKMLLSRNVVRFVIDEAHCFSAWGQDFRVDYLYIGDFIRKLQEQKKQLQKNPIPVSCFTATAKQKVVTDICDYFKQKLNLDLEVFSTTSARKNLQYVVQHVETDDEKYSMLRNLISANDCPTIVYVSRTAKSVELAIKLTSDGYPAKAYNGKMDPNEKIKNQNAFINDEIKVMVATSAFGMGVDKSNVGLVVHYDISDSLENYVQEAGRAGRDPNMQAKCFVLYNDSDLDKHFILLNQSKLSLSEIQQVWKAIKDLTKMRHTVCCSALEIARQAGWDDSVSEVETRVKTAVAALETAGYVKRGNNVPHVYATSIRVKDMNEAHERILKSPYFSDKERENAVRIIKSLISCRSIAKARDEDAESRVDYLADILGLPKESVVMAVNLMRQEGILSDEMDISAYIMKSDSENKSKAVFEKFAKLETFLLSCLSDEGLEQNVKELNENALDAGASGSTVKNIRTLLHFLKVKGYVHVLEKTASDVVAIMPCFDIDMLKRKALLRMDLCRYIIGYLFDKADLMVVESDEQPVTFSMLGILKGYKSQLRLDVNLDEVNLLHVEEALLYLSKIGALKLEGGFLVLYNALEINRVADNKTRYKVDDYRLLNEFYKQKIRQIHIVGEYANLMVGNYEAALQFVHDYFYLDFKKFISKYFKGERAIEIDKNITPEKYRQLFGNLSDRQRAIINDKNSKCIVVGAGPGSGKTKVLVHKLASLLLMEDVKHEQLLMLTFSRAAATEFKKRLIGLIGGAAHFVEIKTFHSYSFDLIGKVGNLDEAKDVVRQAAQMIENGEVERGRIAKSVLVIDEAQDMDGDEFNLVRALMNQNEEMRVIAVGDDDQNIYEWRGSNSSYFSSLISDCGARFYEMVDNFRSEKLIVDFANAFVRKIRSRMKTEPILAMRNGGEVVLTKHVGANLEVPVVEQVKRTYRQGRASVLTRTNDEAVQVVGLLHKEGIRAKLIQSMDGFRFYDLMEIRYLLKVIDSELHTPVIDNELWERAKHKLMAKYKDSCCLENVLNFMEDFERLNKMKYRTDLAEFINESSFEDFYDDEMDFVYVSTIHKAKGREFDSVYLMLNQANVSADAECRKLYVGMTRAKNSLFVHYNGDLFRGICVPGVEEKSDFKEYAEPEQIVMQLTHRDVYLDFFKDKKQTVLNLRSGDRLVAGESGLSIKVDDENKEIVRFSKQCRENMANWMAKGYELVSAEVRFVVAWKNKDAEQETAVVLPNVLLKKFDK